MVIGKDGDEGVDGYDVEERRQTFHQLDVLKARAVELWDGKFEVELEVDDPAHRTEMVLEGFTRCYEHLEAQYNKLRRVARRLPLLNAEAIVDAVRDATVVDLHIRDGVAYSKVTMRAGTHWQMAVDQYVDEVCLVQLVPYIEPAYGGDPSPQ